MKEFPTLYTPRLTLSQLSLDHLPALVKYANNKHISNNIINIPFPYSDIHASMRLAYVLKGFNEQSRFCFAILLIDTAAFIGEISLHVRNASTGVAELGYWIGAPHWNHGYASEAIEAVIEFGFTRAKYKTIYATCNIDNAASIRLLVKNKMTKFKETSSQLAYKISVEDYKHA